MSIVLVAAFAAALLVVGACTEEPGAGDASSAPLGLIDSAGDSAGTDSSTLGPDAAARVAGLPEWLLRELRDVPRPDGEFDPQMIDDECCDEVGMVDDCWMVDAADDGIICPDFPTAPAGAPECLSPLGCDATNTLCECEDDGDCNDGGARKGRCIIQAGDTSGLCGPSWCNGYKICSCWGGCITPPTNPVPSDNCAEAGLSCCEGDYPILPASEDDPVGTGYCSDDSSCGAGCTADADCDDGNACTLDDCIISTGECAHTDVVCDDDNVCTDDVCNMAIGCVFTDNTDPCDDGDACTTGDVCTAGDCEPTGALDCSDGNPCSSEVCESATGCVYSLNPIACSDGNACTVGDLCGETSPGNYGCVPGGPLACDDGEWCTTDSCNTATGCVFTDNALACDDGDACTTGDVCAGGDCTSTGTLNCDDGQACTDDSCDDALGCVNTADDSNTCSDGNACTLDDCTGGVCVSTPISCDDGNACTNDGCNPATGCWHTNNTNPCNDGNACTINDACSGGSCVGGGPLVCNDGNVCTNDSCNTATGCVYTNNTAACTDGSLCTVGDQCAGGICVPGPAPNCNDSNVCTTDSCNPLSGCVNANNTNACSDGNACTTGDQCSGGACVGGAPLTCNDSNICTNDSCNTATGCVYANNTAVCSDGNACTTGDQCSGGACVGGAPTVCNDGLACTQNLCNTVTGCYYPVIPNCCTVNADCGPANGGCAAALTTIAAGGCAESRCVANSCTCYMSPAGTACTAYDPGDYPPNCYAGYCGNTGTGVANGICAGQYTGVAPANNLCSDLWSADTTLNTANLGYVGQFPNSTGSASFSKTGSTRCGYDNYRATGEDCTDKDLVNGLGSQSKDVVYVFEYQVGTATQFNLYSYVVTVQADYDVAIYIEDSITSRSTCPEGNNPTADVTTDTVVDGPRCAFPYNDAAPTPPPYVSEDECNESGNSVKGQSCCDPCLSGGMAASTCGYKWCTRGYDIAGTACNQCVPGDCDAAWTYPQDPINCDPGLPAPPGYSDYTYTASAVIFPDGATDSTWRKVFVFVDGEGADAVNGGNFYLTVEKRLWYASPCDRVNDDPRVYDVTSVGAAGQTFLGTLANAVNSTHIGSGACAGYSCDNTDWMGGTDCHSSYTGNMFWPAAVQFKVDREWGTGASTYCFVTDESITSPADIVIDYASRDDPDAPSICDEYYSSWSNWCEWNNFGNNARVEFTVDEGEFWLFGISERNYRNKPCVPGVDSCNFKLTVYEGACPAMCVAPLGGAAGNFNMAGSYYDNVFGSGTIIPADGDHYNPYGASDGHDQVWTVYNTTGATQNVQFTLVPLAGTDPIIAVYDCELNLLARNDAGGNGASETVTVSVPVSTDPIHVVADTYPGGAALGAYSLRAKWGTPPVVCDAPLGESPTGITPINLSANNGVWKYGTLTAGHVNNYSPPTGWGTDGDEIWAYVNDTGATRSVTARMCSNDAGGLDSALGIYTCKNVALSGVDNLGSAGVGAGCESITRNMTAGEVWYVDADAYSGSDGPYMLRLSY